MNLSDIRHLFDYTEWANQLTLNAAAALSDEDLRHDFKISHGSIFATLLHMAGAEWIWLERWCGRSPAGKEAWSLWTTDSCTDLKVLTERWNEVIERRAQLISQLEETGLAADLPFTLLSGDASALAAGGSNATCSQSCDTAPRTSSRYDPTARHYASSYRFAVLFATRNTCIITDYG